MPSRFAAEVLEATAACDEVMAELFQLSPQKPSVNMNAAAGADASRQPLVFAAVFIDPEAKPLIANAYDARTDLRPGTQSSHPRLQVSPAELAKQPLLAIRPADLLTRLSNGQIWKVSTTSVTTQGVLKAFVNLV